MGDTAGEDAEREWARALDALNDARVLFEGEGTRS